MTVFTRTNTAIAPEFVLIEPNLPSVNTTLKGFIASMVTVTVYKSDMDVYLMS